jgi:hypothetical protein
MLAKSTYKQRARTEDGVGSQTPRRSSAKGIHRLKGVTTAAKLLYQPQKERELKESDSIMIKDQHSEPLG